MTETERYLWTFDRGTGEPIGIVDTYYSPQGAQGVVHGPAVHQQYSAVYQPPQPVQVPQPEPQVWRPRPVTVASRPEVIRAQQQRWKLYGYGVAVIFAAGIVAGCLFFGDREPHAPVVYVCQTSSSYPFAPAEGPVPAHCAPEPTPAEGPEVAR